MPGFADEYEQQQVKQMDAFDSAKSHAEVATPPNGASVKPPESVLTKWQDHACAAPAAPVVCETPASAARHAMCHAEPTPDPFKLPVPLGSQSVPPPRPIDWSGAPARPTCPSEMMTSNPAFMPAYQSENLEPYKDAFTSSWSDVRTKHNMLVTLHRAHKDTERDVVPILQLDASRPLGAGLQGLDASNSFNGAKLKPSLNEIDSSKVPKQLRAQIFRARDRIKTIELEIEIKRHLITNANASFAQATNDVVSAANDVDLQDLETQTENLQLDKDEVRRDLEDFKAKAKLNVERAKSVTAFINMWANPTKLFDNMLGLVNQWASTSAASEEAEQVVGANARLSAIDGRIRSLRNQKGALLSVNATMHLNNALIEVEKRITDSKVAVLALEGSMTARGDAHREMGELIEKAGAASGLNPRDSKAVAGAVEALPKVEGILDQLQSIELGLESPPYSEASGSGAAMASNASVFTNALSVVKGNREYVVELRALWESRRASVLAVVERTVAVKGAE